jgi:hypothetical protein
MWTVKDSDSCYIEINKTKVLLTLDSEVETILCGGERIFFHTDW